MMIVFKKQFRHPSERFEEHYRSKGCSRKVAGRDTHWVGCLYQTCFQANVGMEMDTIELLPSFASSASNRKLSIFPCYTRLTTLS